MQNSSAFQHLAIDTIHESTTNPRRTFDQNKLRELAESIKNLVTSMIGNRQGETEIPLDLAEGVLPTSKAFA